MLTTVEEDERVVDEEEVEGGGASERFFLAFFPFPRMIPLGKVCSLGGDVGSSLEKQTRLVLFASDGSCSFSGSSGGMLFTN